MKAQILATEIVQKLVIAGYKAYFAGGWVRDFLLGHPSEDIDIATDAPPEIILDLFPHTILVGLAFGVVIVIYDGHQFDVATFRRDIEYLDGRKPTQIELSTAEGDASRRDFTINGMFYDPIDEVVHDFVHGQEDLKHRIIRTIGDPYERFSEDRLRMVRAVRFAARFGFVIEQDTQDAIRANADTLFPAVAMERIWHEFGKMAKYPRFDGALIDMHRLGLLSVIFPELRNVHLNEIKKQVASFQNYPAGVDTLWYLLELFPEATEKDVEELGTYLHTSKLEAHRGAFLVTLKRAAYRDFDKVAWTHHYAHPAIHQALQVVAARMNHVERDVFFNQHRQQMVALEKHIDRVVEKKPLVNAAILQAQGIAPGKLMGLLIKEAERITILHDYKDADSTIITLKTSPWWPK